MKLKGTFTFSVQSLSSCSAGTVSCNVITVFLQTHRCVSLSQLPVTNRAQHAVPAESSSASRVVLPLTVRQHHVAHDCSVLNPTIDLSLKLPVAIHCMFLSRCAFTALAGAANQMFLDVPAWWIKL